MIDTLIEWAVEFQKDSDCFTRDSHMFGGLREQPTDAQKAAVLTGFLNFCGNKCCMDLGMYLRDFEEQVDN